jgi:hypothetical protein
MVHGLLAFLADLFDLFGPDAEPFQEALVGFRMPGFEEMMPSFHGGFIQPDFLKHGYPLFLSDTFFHMFIPSLLLLLYHQPSLEFDNFPL